MKESILYGTKVNKPDYMEEIISTVPANFERVTQWAIRNGFNRLRISTIDTDIKPDFIQSINHKPKIMKKLQIRMFVVLVAAQFAFFGIAELNYSNAIREAIASDGSDAAIEEAMGQHGFNVSAMGPAEPNLLDKSAALIKLL